MKTRDICDRTDKEQADIPRLFCDPATVLVYDFNDTDGLYYMLDHDMGGCLALPFTKTMQTGPGEVLLDGKKISHVVKTLKLGGFTAQWLGIRLRGRIREYGQTGALTIRGFTDTDGLVMETVTLTVQAIQKNEPLKQYAEHEAIARQAAEEGIVLLKNENHVLPLSQTSVLNIFGKGLFEFRVCAVGAGKINARYTVGLREAIKSDNDIRLNTELETFYADGMDKIPDEEMLRRARQLSDTAIMVISRASGENYDNSSEKGAFYLTDAENNLLAAIADDFYHTIVIINSGYPIETGFIDTYDVDAVLYTGYGGMLGGQAVLDVLTGKVNPSGHVTDTWSVEYKDIPAAANFYDCGDGRPVPGADDELWINTVYEEDIYVGYRYFETFKKRIGFPFGYGLSYTDFFAAVNTYRWTKNGLSLEISVKNTGKRPGKYSLQIYTQKPASAIEKPTWELIEFEKTNELTPGQSQHLSLDIPQSRFTVYDDDRAAYILDAGIYKIYAGGDVRSAACVGSFEVEKTKLVRQVENRMQPVMNFTALSQLDPHSAPSGQLFGVTGKRDFSSRVMKHYPIAPWCMESAGNEKLTFKEVLEDETKLPAFILGLPVETLARLAVCASDGWGMEGQGEAGRIYLPEGLGLPKFVVADGNSGVNVKKRNIGFPSGVTLCSSFNKSLMEDVGRVIGEEARELGIDLILAPAFNIHRNPLCGRHPEYFSEDPYLAGKMAGYYCRGLESTGIGGCYKHLMANNAESSRKRNQSVISERAIREIYFKAFEYALEEYEPVSVMTAYNAVNGVFASEDADLLLGLMREENHFQGFFMTDWESYASADIVSMEAAGNTWITPGSEDETYTAPIVQAVQSGQLSVERLRENLFYFMKALLKLQKNSKEVPTYGKGI